MSDVIQRFALQPNGKGLDDDRTVRLLATTTPGTMSIAAAQPQDSFINIK